MFMHGGLLHLGGNMLFLWIFGNNVEDAMGPVQFLVFYLLGGLAALGAADRDRPRARRCRRSAPRARSPAVLGGYLLLYPRARVLTVVFIILFFTFIELPALLFLGIWFLQQALFGAFDLTDPTGGGGGVAYFAHIGGFVFGLLRDQAVRAAATTPTSPASARRGVTAREHRPIRRRVRPRAAGVLTLAVAVAQGPDVLTVLSLLVLAMFGFGVFGALGSRRA